MSSEQHGLKNDVVEAVCLSKALIEEDFKEGSFKPNNFDASKFGAEFSERPVNHAASAFICRVAGCQMECFMQYSVGNKLCFLGTYSHTTCQE